MQCTLTPRQTPPPGGGSQADPSPLSLAATPSGSLAGNGGDLHTQLQRSQAKATAWKASAQTALELPGAPGPFRPCSRFGGASDRARRSDRPPRGLPAPAACRACRPSPANDSPRTLPPGPPSWPCSKQDKAHRLGDLIVKQDAQCQALQRQLDGLRAAQQEALAAAAAGDADAALSPADLSAMRGQLALAQAQLRVQAQELEAARADYGTRQELLREAAGAARREVLALQDANRSLQAAAERLQRQNDELAAQLRGAQAAPEPGGGSGAGEGWGSAGPSPAKRHADTALLHALVRKQDGCAAVSTLPVLPCVAACTAAAPARPRRSPRVSSTARTRSTHPLTRLLSPPPAASCPCCARTAPARRRSCCARCRRCRWRTSGRRTCGDRCGQGWCLAPGTAACVLALRTGWPQRRHATRAHGATPAPC